MKGEMTVSTETLQSQHVMVNEAIWNQEPDKESLYRKISYKNVVMGETFEKNDETINHSRDEEIMEEEEIDDEGILVFLVSPK